MSEDDDYDELPPITVNSSGRDASLFAMPCALELAEQRARAERCEEELRRLRGAEGEECAWAPLAHSDSSGSEGEAALAAAVGALQVRAALPRAPPPPLSALVAAATTTMPQTPFLAEFARVSSAAPPPLAAELATRTLKRVECGACSACVAPECEEASACAAWLCLALAAPGAGGREARAAHALLERCGAADACALAPALLGALCTTRARLRVADALRGGAGYGGSRALAEALERGALSDLLPAAGWPDTYHEDEARERAWCEAAAASWRRLEPRDQLHVLQLAGRVRAHHPPPHHERAHRLLHAARPTTHDHRPGSLQVQVAASKLQVLFPNIK